MLLTFDRSVIQQRFNDLLQKLRTHFKLDDSNVGAITCPGTVHIIAGVK